MLLHLQAGWETPGILQSEPGKMGADSVTRLSDGVGLRTDLGKSRIRRDGYRAKPDAVRRSGILAGKSARGAVVSEGVVHFVYYFLCFTARAAIRRSK